MFNTPCVSHVTCHISHVTYHTSHVTFHMTLKSRNLKFWDKGHNPLCVICHISSVMCQSSHVMCHVSDVTCHRFFFGFFSSQINWAKGCREKERKTYKLASNACVNFFLGWVNLCQILWCFVAKLSCPNFAFFGKYL